MTDRDDGNERDDRMDALLRQVAQDYHRPPAAPRAEMWARIAADRAARPVPPPAPALRFPLRGPWLGLGIAALLFLGVAIGRFTAPGGSPPAAPGVQASAPVVDPTAPGSAPAGGVAAQVATYQLLGRAETFLIELSTRDAAAEFPGRARELLGTTRLLLDSKRLTDVRTRKLLDDLELVLTQIAALDPANPDQDLDFIADGLAQNHLRTRLRSLIPAGPAIRM